MNRDGLPSAARLLPPSRILLRAILGLGCMALIALLSVVAPVRGHSVSPGSDSAFIRPATAAGFYATAFWNGANISTATSVSTALSTSFGTLGNLTFRWAWSGSVLAAPPFGIAHAHLQVLFFSQPTYSKDQSFSPPLSAASGSYSLVSDLTETKYLLEGIFLLYCDLTDASSNTVWSQTFYVHVTAAYHLTVANVGLFALAAYEVVQLIRVGPHALPKAKLKTKVEAETKDKGAG